MAGEGPIGVQIGPEPDNKRAVFAFVGYWRGIGATNDLARRVWQHRQGIASRFTRRYYLKHLVYAERHDDIGTAIHRETSLKRWPRAWKVALIEERNPEWKDLGEQFP